MPTKPLKPCRYPGCRKLTHSGFCEQHQPRRTQDRSQKAQTWRWMYQTPEWKDDLRPTQLLEHPWCAECSRQGHRVRATDVDHIVDHKGSWALFTDRSNLQSLCHGCHSRKTATELWQKRKGSRRR